MRFMAEHAHFFSLLEVEGRNFTDVLRQGTEQHVGDMVALIEAGQADGTIRDEDPELLALGVVGAVGHYSHFHRTGRITLPLDELAAFVGPLRRALRGRRRRGRRVAALRAPPSPARA